jgi:PS-10 peptidase S37
MATVQEVMASTVLDSAAIFRRRMASNLRRLDDHGATDEYPQFGKYYLYSRANPRLTIVANPTEVWIVRWLAAVFMMIITSALVVPQQATASAPVDDIVAQLQHLPRVTYLSEDPNPPTGFRQFYLEYKQPVDHRHPGRGTFEQHLTLLHRDVTAPMVVFTSGYFNYEYEGFEYVTEPTKLVAGNQLDIEHRYFGDSVPQPTVWPDLNIWQEATDEHDILTTFKSLYQAKWLDTGISKGGMTTVFHMRFYPHDFAGILAYSAPNDITDRGSAYADFINDKVGTAQCRADLRRVQVEALAQRAGMESLMATAAKAAGDTFKDIGSFDKAFEFDIVDTPFVFWQYYDDEPGTSCATIPKPGAPVADLYTFFDNVGGTPGGMIADSDQAEAPFLPYYYQAGTQLDYPVEPQAYLVKLLHHPYAESARQYFPRSVPMHFDPRVMLDIDNWVRTHGDHMIFTYGGLDPYGATPFRLGPGSRDSAVYKKPDGDHLTTIARLDPSQQSAITATLRRWAGEPAITASPFVASTSALPKIGNTP